MNLPKLDISALPDLDVLTGMFGSLKHFDPGLAASNDLITLLMVYLYETLPTPTWAAPRCASIQPSQS